jgi:putative ABC transport system permease protein
LVGRFAGMELGETLRFAQRDWTVVGIMDHAGSAYDSELWADLDQVMDAFQRRPTVSSLTLALGSDDDLAALQARLEADPALSSLQAQRETDYWAAQSEELSRFVKYLGLFVAVVFSLGATLGAMITMYAQVSQRTREIGAGRALGFRRRAVLVSFVVESVLLALAAGLVGAGAASAMQWLSFSTTNFQTFSEISFHFHLTGSIVAAALLFALFLGFAGGLLPATRAARIPIVRAMRG